MKQLITTFCLALLIASPGLAQEPQFEINTLWMTTHNDDGAMLPILIKKGRTLDANGNEVNGGEGPAWANGSRTSDTYMGLERYDESRLLLGIFNNGINENDPNDNLELAEQFPDRSLIWIDAGTGEPLGIALEIGIEPVEIPQYYADAAGVPIPLFTDFSVSDDGLIYVAFGPFILRYTPDGSGEFTGPETVFQITEEQITSEELPAEDWGVSTFNVQGAGGDTIITGGQNSTGFYINTSDGNNFELAFTYMRDPWPPLGGAQSSVIFNSFFEEEWIFTSGYGNNSSGDDSVFYRLVRPADTLDPFVDDSDLFSARGVEDAGDDDYQANYIGDVDGHTELEWVAAYSTPSWDISVRRSPGFLALHDVSGTAPQDGLHISNIKLDVYSDEEPSLPGATTSSWYGTEGNLQVNVLEGSGENAGEILWSGGIYGFGRFAVGDIPTDVNTWPLF